jgi:hypothetical protein
MKTIATLLRHTTTRMTERYTHAGHELHRAVQGIGRIGSELAAKHVTVDVAPASTPEKAGIGAEK